MRTMLVMMATLLGCGSAEEPEIEGPTWHQDVAPILAESCTGCHTDGGIAPFSLEEHQDAADLAWLIADAVEDRRMPPWGALDTEECVPPLPWKDDRRLTDEQIATLRAWSDAGAPEGDPATAAPLPDPPALALEDATARYEMPTEHAVGGEEDVFRCFVLDGALEDDVWLTGLQVVPGNDAVVHHVLVFLDPHPDEQSELLAGEDGGWDCFGELGFSDTALIGAWAPGSLPMEPPEGVGTPIEAGSRFVVNVHYHPTGDSTELDRTAIDLKWTTEQPDWETYLFLIGNFDESWGEDQGLLPGPNDPEDGVEFRIPAGATDHVETMQYTLEAGLPELRLWLVGTHMHYVGTDMRIDVISDDESEQCLVRTPEWDFSWQRGYVYDVPIDEAVPLQGNDTLRMTCRYDNTLDNPYVRLALEEQGLDEPIDVTLGEETLDEMCLGVFGIAWPTF